MALHFDDGYLKLPAIDTIERIKLYCYSLSRYGNSPYIYPLWGLGGLPEGFSRLAAINGGTYMLNKPIEKVLYNESGHVTGVVDLEGKVARCTKLIADPSYFLGTDKIRKTGQVARCICILSNPIPMTNDADSCQIILPAKTVAGRKSDIYLSCVSFHHQVAAKGKYIAVASCPVESKDGIQELTPAINLLGKKIEQKFFWISDQYEATADGAKDNVFITSTYDASTHFESATREVIDMFSRLTGKALDLTISADPEDLDPAAQAAADAAAASSQPGDASPANTTQ